MPLIFYPAIIEPNPSGEGFGIVFPDLPGCASAGDTVQHAAAQAAEALALHLQGMGEDGEPIPEPSAVNAPLPDWLGELEPGAIRVLVPVERESKTERLNITLDSALVRLIDNAAGGNRSGWLAEAARYRLAPNGPYRVQYLELHGKRMLRAPGRRGGGAATVRADRFDDIHEAIERLGELHWQEQATISGLRLVLPNGDTINAADLFASRPGGPNRDPSSPQRGAADGG
ncbi:type II toxin-antitoxin system HicB family antitoxin [Pararoseomonas sp. SCSIO 73927]|uniref:type II toxin-antitoxin system HicB family antitoxin n=1 Tax=Pararoseomonas sp. SCSIO 73927 TaxID=3114537 RepID=UPI0030D3A46C